MAAPDVDGPVSRIVGTRDPPWPGSGAPFVAGPAGRVGRRRASSPTGPAVGRRRRAERRAARPSGGLAARDVQRLRAVVGPDRRLPAARAARLPPRGTPVADDVDV